jgi:hypothetical protein
MSAGIVNPQEKPTAQASAQIREDCDLQKVSRENSMCSEARLQNLEDWLAYLAHERIHGDFVECGVWRGGCSAVILHALISNKAKASFWLFDTFEGMPQPTKNDVDFAGNAAYEKWASLRNTETEFSDWCAATLSTVKQTLAAVSCDYQNHCRFVVGKVEETLLQPKNIPESICLLRLDTDWYESTRAELEILFPRVSVGGVIIIDDYTDWQGARKATDEFLLNNLFKYPCKHQIVDGSLVLVRI